VSPEDRLKLIVEIEAWLVQNISGVKVYNTHSLEGGESATLRIWVSASTVYASIAGGPKALLENTSDKFLATARDGYYLNNDVKPLPPEHPVWQFVETYDEDK